MIPRMEARTLSRWRRGVFTTASECLPQLVACEQPFSAATESFRSLRSSLLLGGNGTTPKTVVVTSAASSEGKSFTAANCAIVLAQQGAKVLLVDADLRHSSLHQRFDISPSPGLSGILAETCEPSAAYVATGVSANLTLLPAGEGLTYPAEMLASKMMRQLLLRWKEEYDHVLIDTPPVCLFTDAVVLGSQADAALIVVRASQTTKHALRRTRDLMFRADAQIAGAVLNAVDWRYQGSYYFQRYSSLGQDALARFYDS